MTCAQGLLRLLWGGPKLECYGTGGAPCDRYGTVSDFLKNKEVEVWQWPGNSPDVDPKENL